MLYATQPGPSDRQADLASIGMAVWVTRTVGASGIPVTETSPTPTGLPPTQTVTTHQDMKGVVVSVLDDSLLARQPGEPDDNNLDEINMDFAEELLKDDGEETIENMVRTYNQRIEVPQRTQDPSELELYFSSMNLGEESDSDPKIPPSGVKGHSPMNPADSSAGRPTLSSEDVEMSEEQGEPL